MLAKLQKHDPNLVALEDQEGAVLVSPGLQGRIFCHIRGQLVHRLDVARLERPSPDEFNNLGGNSLWPAPEGGDFAFNYGPDTDRWVVQDGVAKQPARLVYTHLQRAEVAKTISLKNRKGVEIALDYRRRVEKLDQENSSEAGIITIAYECTDSLEPLGDYSQNDVLVAPWSLEQFPGGAGVTAFCVVDEPSSAINFDFYGMPETPPVYADRHFSVQLGGKARFQIGVKVSHNPRVVGALDRSRSLLLLRSTERQTGVYFNIADNDQPAGPWSAADIYSVFNGGELDFFELETVAPMQVKDGRVRASWLVSRTEIHSGRISALEALVRERFNVVL